MDFYVTPKQYEIAESYGIDQHTVDRRVRALCWSVQKAITTPKRKKIDRKKWVDMAKSNGINYQTFMSRINQHGWTEKKAATAPLQDKNKSVIEMAIKKRRYSKELVKEAERNGIPYATFRSRILKGWDDKKASTTPVISSSEAGRRGAFSVREKYGDWNKII